MGPVVARLRGRATHRALMHPDGRATSGPIRVAFVAGDGEGGLARVGYAIGKRHGNAVRRNRLRRRLREGVRQAATSGRVLRPGAYLVRAEPDACHLAYPELVRRLEEAMTQAACRAGGRRGPVT